MDISVVVAGGGYYGGGGTSWHSQGGGGSSFISGHSGCNAITEEGTHTGKSEHYSRKSLYKHIND
ncbi:MAG: hypothetical protein HFJ50_03390 [Clostridia bacterium]|nr:hypothetical protein [Clostridia bacterium]